MNEDEDIRNDMLKDLNINVKIISDILQNISENDDLFKNIALIFSKIRTELIEHGFSEETSEKILLSFYQTSQNFLSKN